MESFGTALLRVKEISEPALVLAVAMQQEADPNGYVGLTDTQLRKAAASIAVGRSYTIDIIKAAREELLTNGILVAPNQVRPLESGDPTSFTKEQAEALFYGQIHDDGSEAKPDSSFSQLHSRVYGALLAVHMAPAMMKINKQPLRDDDGNVVLVEGRRRWVRSLTWDYASASKLLREYSIEQIVDACFAVWGTLKADKRRTPPVIDADADDIQDVLRRYRGYLMGVLGSPAVPDDDDDEPIILRN